MPSTDRPAPRVAVIGAGISGLAAAHRIGELAPAAELSVFEASADPGGVLQTRHRNGFLIERSADNFLTRDPWAKDLCRRVGLGDELLPTNELLRRALVVHNGRLLPAPRGFVIMSPQQLWPTLCSPILSWPGKLRLLRERWIPARNGNEGGEEDDESVASFARRRLGNEVYQRLVQPLLAGIYTADPERLSMAATMPKFLKQERQHKSLRRAALAEQEQANKPNSSDSGAQYGLFVAPRLGMGQLVEALVERLPASSLRLSTPIRSIQRNDKQWHIVGEDAAPLGSFDAAIVTAPAHHAASILRTVNDDLATGLADIEYAGCSIVCLAYRRSQIREELPGFGFVAPTIEQRRLIAVSFASLKFPDRAPEDHVLLRAFVGGALQPELAKLPDEELTTLVREELGELLGARGDPVLTEIARWDRGMPQYHVGHLTRVERIESLVATLPGLELAGAAYRGVGVPQCVHGGELAAERVAEYLAD